MVVKEDGLTAHELETFIPSEGPYGKNTTYKVTSKRELENGTGYNPFTERKNPNPVTDRETLTHLLKASLGSGILSMPIAFMHSGLIVGIFATILTAFICTHCCYILVKCSHTLYKRTKVHSMSFSEVAEVAFKTGPAFGRPFATSIKWLILISLFITYFGTCSVYTVIIAKNFSQVIDHHTGTITDERIIIAALLVPLILLSWVPNLKYLAPVSMVANFFMATGLGITFYYLVTDMPPVSSVSYVPANIMALPSFFAITIFAMEAIGVVMPLENQMKTPQNFIGICGVLNQGMSGVTLVYILLGFLGYVRYGTETEGSITLNLKVELIPAQVVKILIGLAVYCTFGLQFYVCVEIGWNALKDYFTKRPMLVNYVMRTVLVAAAVLVAIAVPTIAPFVGLIGAFCFSILGLMVPVLIETVTYWDDGFGFCKWVAIKNVVIILFGIMALIFGSKNSIEDIISEYSPKAVNLTTTTLSPINNKDNFEAVTTLLNNTIATTLAPLTEAAATIIANITNPN